MTAAAAAFWYRNETASLDMGQALYDSWGQQPWTIVDNMAKAYSREVERQKAVDAEANSKFGGAKAWRPPVDPLMLDLDGNSLELSRASCAILFEYSARGVRPGAINNRVCS
jgi:hypothetical protein